MELKSTITLKVKAGSTVNLNNFVETTRTLTNETRTVYLKRGEEPITYNLEIVEGVIYSALPYKVIVKRLISEKYSIDDEVAIQRQKENKPKEFEEYYDFVENCKTIAKAFIAERDEALNNG